ncbi:PilN domain-containing protein [Neobacillus drentensis]|uniref:PilN domain-containing protein n=1 Tax=Neobacillus drentensis TaxID=220684 RepID=UPI001F3D6738|nr:PilN domain-containing protein [Neobacillus drentensis]ULT55832.1 PilN domain-containing protein [Neobacillus drentensis]
MMLVEINLLPQKEPKKFNIIYLSTIVAVLALISGLYFWQIQSIKSEVDSADKQIAMTKKIAEKEEKSTQTTEVASSASLLKTSVDWATDYPIQTIPVMRHLNSLLPERGFIQSFAYTEAGTVTISVQFDSTREAAYFLESLKESDWIEDASLNSLSATETEQSAANTSAQSTGQTATSAATEQTTASTTNTASQGTVSNQATTTVGQTSQINTAGTTINQNNTNSTNTGVGASGTAAATTKPDQNILPRYVGQFEIKFNKDAIKESTKEKRDEEGVTAP